ILPTITLQWINDQIVVGIVVDVDGVGIGSPGCTVRVQIRIILFGAVRGPAQSTNAELLHEKHIDGFTHLVTTPTKGNRVRSAQVYRIQSDKTFVDSPANAIIAVGDAAGKARISDDKLDQYIVNPGPQALGYAAIGAGEGQQNAVQDS